MFVEPSYTLDDPRHIAANARYTYFIPNSAEITAVANGDLVQLLFRHAHETEKWGVERMWVTVEQEQNGLLIGILENEPYEPTAKLKLGDTIYFERYNIISILWANPKNAPPPDECREYWDRCLVEACVLDGTHPVEFICRHEPEMVEEDDKHPDSGWSIRGRRGEDTDEEMEAREVRYVALGAVLNQDDSWVHLVDAPVGTALMRNFETGVYAPE